MNSIKKIKITDNLEFFTVSKESKKEVPFIDTMVSAGFPSPADDYLDLPIDLNEYLVDNSAATFYIRVTGNSMQDEGIDDGDLLVVDRSKTPKNNDIIIGVLNGEFTVKTIQKTNQIIPLNTLMGPRREAPWLLACCLPAPPRHPRCTLRGARSRRQLHAASL